MPETIDDDPARERMARLSQPLSQLQPGWALTRGDRRLLQLVEEP